MDGPETLGVQRLTDKRVSYYNKVVPLPTVLSYQLDTLAIMCLKCHHDEVIKCLKRKIFATNRTKNWYEVFLTTFVLLSNLEYLHRMQRKYMQRHEDTVRILRNSNFKSDCSSLQGTTYSRVSYVSDQMIKTWEYSAENLVNHFRVVLGGSVPFSLSWEKSGENHCRAGIDGEACEYIRTITTLLVQRSM